jgi:hypothetical protein
MRCCKKKAKSTFKLAILLSLYIYSSIVNAEGILISKAGSHLVEDGYELQADFKITLSPTIEDALLRGVSLNFISELTITRSRWYWFDSEIIQTEQQSKLTYNALTQQFRISRGTLFQSFPNLESALQVLGHQTSQPISITSLSVGNGYITKLIKGEAKFTAYAQMRLDKTQLPKPLQVNALTNSEWNLESEKHTWIINPEISQNEGRNNQ